MRDVTLVGSFTVAGREDRTPTPDRYEIASVEKVGRRPVAVQRQDGLLRHEWRGTLPIVVPMRWVGDTPVIMMTDTSLPGIGTFTVRVFFYGDRYAGTWQHGASAGTCRDVSRRRRAKGRKRARVPGTIDGSCLASSQAI